MTTRLLWLLALVIGVSCAANGAVPAPRATILVLDASGSMWIRLSRGGPRRGEIAQSFVDGFTGASASRAASIGFVRFGYRYAYLDPHVDERTKCNDTESLKPNAAGADARKQLDEIATASGVHQDMSADGKGWNPKGKTPITQALEAAYAMAPPQGADIVVVTDVVDNEYVCEPDPCPSSGLAPELAALARPGVHVRFVVAAGLDPYTSARAARLARCFDAEFLDPRSREEATQAGARVARHTFANLQPAPRDRLRDEPPETLADQPKRVDEGGGGDVAVAVPKGTGVLILGAHRPDGAVDRDAERHLSFEVRSDPPDSKVETFAPGRHELAEKLYTVTPMLGGASNARLRLPSVEVQVIGSHESEVDATVVR